MNMFVIDGPPVYANFRASCRELGFGGGRCGSRYKSSAEDAVQIPCCRQVNYAYDFAANGEGFRFQDAATYDLAFSAGIDPIGDQYTPGEAVTRYYDSDDLLCPENNRPCYLP